MAQLHCCVVGGGGFIGGHLINLLHGGGRRLTVIDTKPQPLCELPQGVRYLAGDYGDRGFLRRSLRDVDEIIHLAYATVPQTSFEDPVRDIAANLPLSVGLFVEAAALRLSKLLVISSGGTVYGRARKLPIGEEHPTNPLSPYGITKLAVEKYALMFHELHGLPVVIVRPGNPFGPHQVPFAGQGFVGTAIASIIQGRGLTLYGERGTVRDYIHVTDVAAGIAAALSGGAPGSCYNVGTGVGRSNLEILDALAPLAAREGFRVQLRVEPARPFDVPVNVLDSSKLTAETGWRPRVPFQEGITETWNWYRRSTPSGPVR